MNCPNCGSKSKVTNIRKWENEEYKRRARKCNDCELSFNSYEISDADFSELLDCKEAFEKIKNVIGLFN